MLNIEIKKEKMEPQKEEFRRLLVWIVEHHDEWECICNMASFEPPVEKQLEIVDELIKTDLLSIAYVVLNLDAGGARGMELIKDQIINEVIADASTDRLLEVIEKNMAETKNY